MKSPAVKLLEYLVVVTLHDILIFLLFMLLPLRVTLLLCPLPSSVSFVSCSCELFLRATL